MCKFIGQIKIPKFWNFSPPAWRHKGIRNCSLWRHKSRDVPEILYTYTTYDIPTTDKISSFYYMQKYDFSGGGLLGPPPLHDKRVEILFWGLHDHSTHPLIRIRLIRTFAISNEILGPYSQ